MLKLITIAAGLLAAAPALAQTSPSPQPISEATIMGRGPGDVRDPWERTNRGLYAVHKGVDRTVLGPVSRGYKAVTPAPVRKGVRNVLNNLGEPITFINDVLQLKPVRAGETATRFVANTTFGVLGLFDVASSAGVPIHYEDFGQTLAVYGVGPGPYVFVPILGPSNLRDIGGRVTDVAVNPVNQATFSGASAAKTGVYVANAVDTRATLDPELRRLEESATDEYATYRSLYAQNRAAAIRNGASADMESLPEFIDYAPREEPRPATPRRRRR